MWRLKLLVYDMGLQVRQVYLNYMSNGIDSSYLCK